MKLEKLKRKLEEKLNLSSISQLMLSSQSTENKKLKIIGVTGSTGKSTVCYVLHKYLQSLGYKSVLYSSIMVDSPFSRFKRGESIDIALNSEKELLDIINCLEKSRADFLILEVNESTIQKGLVKDIPFDIRCITNLNPRHNLERYTEKEYVNLKKSFFENITDECICVYGLQDYDKNLFENLLNANNMPKVTFTSKYISKVKNVDINDITCLLTDIQEVKDGYDFDVKLTDSLYRFHTNNEFKHNILNYLCVIAILHALGKLNVQLLTQCICNTKIPGRTETYKINERTIIIDLHLEPTLSALKEAQEKGKIKKIKVVVGSIGSGFITWDDLFNKGNHYYKRHQLREYACNLLEKTTDEVYLTEDDNGAESALEICNELQNYLQNIPSYIILDRNDAIRKAIITSNKGDAILIVGRGNKRTLCNSSTTIKLVKDSEMVENVLKELGW